MDEKRSWVDPSDPDLSVRRQCELLGLYRSNLYYEAVLESAENLSLMRLIDEEYLRHPFLGSRRMELYLEGLGHMIIRKKVQRFMRAMGIEGLAPGPRTSAPKKGHKIYPYLLGGIEITRPNQVWACDITDVPMPSVYLYLTAVMDWFSRHVLA